MNNFARGALGIGRRQPAAAGGAPPYFGAPMTANAPPFNGPAFGTSPFSGPMAQRPGYGLPGLAQAPSSVNELAAGLGGPEGQGGGGPGGFLKGVMDYFSDPDRGMLRQMLLANVIGTGANIMGQVQQGRLEDEERDRRERRRREMSPMVDDFMRRVRGGG